MSIRKCRTALTAAFLIIICSENSSDAQTPASWKPSSGATTVKIPANQDVTRQVLLPVGTHKLGIKIGSASFTCTSLQPVRQKARNPGDEYFDAAEPINMVARTSVVQNDSNPDDYFALVDIRCHGGAADSELIITPSAS